MKEYAKIGFNVTTFSSSTDNFSVYIKNCSEQVFTLYSNNITYDEFPIYVDVNLLLGDPLCYSYKIVENTTGFFCEGDNNTFTPTPTPTSTVTPTITPTQTVTPSITSTPTVTPTNTQTPTQTSTQTPTQTSTQTPTQTPTVTPTITPTSDPLPILSCSINFNENTSSGNTFDGTFAVEDSPILVNMFTLDSKSNSGKTTYSMSQTILNDIYDNKYRTFDLELPTFKGNKVLLKLQKRDNNSNNIKVTTFNRGISKTKTTKSDSVRYQVLDDSNNIIGGVLFKNDRVEGFYEINSETTTLYKVENSTYNAVFDDDKSEFVCANTLTGVTEQLDIDFSVNTVNNNSYCVGVLWEVPWNLYNKIQTTATYTVEEFIDIQDFWMNSIYSSTSNDVDISFYISGLIIYETLGDDPYDVENFTTGNINNYINVVNNYRYQNYGYIDYDLFLQLNHVRIPVYSGLNGIADGLGGMYGAPNSTNMSLVFGYEIYSVFNYQNSNTYYDIKVVSHETAHNFGLIHTFSAGNFTFNGVSSLPIPGCTGGSCPSIQACKTTLSYCRQWQNLTLDINTTRSLELANFLDTSGDHLICETPPLGSYLEIIIDDTNLTESQNTYTLELKDCNDTQWYTYGTNLPYSSFTLNVYISDLPFSADCYDYKLTEELTNTVCDGNIFVVPSNITPTPTQTPTPTPSITTSITPTTTLTPTQTTTPTSTITPTSTVTQTPTLTPTPSLTPSITPTKLGDGYLFYRFTALDSEYNPTSNAVFLKELNLYGGFNQTGTKYTTEILTSNTSQEGVTVSSGYFLTSVIGVEYSPWRVFDSSSNEGWWTLSITDPNNNWMQIAFDEPTVINSLSLTASTSQFSNEIDVLRVEGSNNGQFNGEQVTLGNVLFDQSDLTEIVTRSLNFSPLPTPTPTPSPTNYNNLQAQVLVLNQENFVSLDSSFKIDSDITINPFNLKSLGDEKVIYESNTELLSEIYQNKYSKINMKLPTFEGEENTFTLDLRTNSNNEYLTIKNRNGSIITGKSQNDIVNYSIKDSENNYLGDIGFTKSDVLGLYEVDGKTTRVKKTNNTEYTYEKFKTSGVTDCGSELIPSGETVSSVIFIKNTIYSPS